MIIIDMSGPHWLPTAEQLRTALAHHLEEEEPEVFQPAGRVLSDDDKKSLAGDYQSGVTERCAS